MAVYLMSKSKIVKTDLGLASRQCQMLTSVINCNLSTLCVKGPCTYVNFIYKLTSEICHSSTQLPLSYLTQHKQHSRNRPLYLKGADC